MKFLNDILKGKDGKYSVRVVLAIFFAFGVAFHVTYCTLKDQTMDGTVVGCLVAAVLGLLGIRAWQEIQFKKNDTNGQTNTQLYPAGDA